LDKCFEFRPHFNLRFFIRFCPVLPSRTYGKSPIVSLPQRLYDFRCPVVVHQLGAVVCERGNQMLWTIFVVLVVLWLLGIVSSYTLGGFIHILLVLALVVLVIRILEGRRPVV
jgi:hypothetical protein